MAFNYCCFVSYPHGQNNVLVPLIKKIVEALEKEIGAQIRKEVWLDSKYLSGGKILDDEIRVRLCQSACMILFYTPLYFDSEHIYCARELKAMQDLETKRLEQMSSKGDGLIIPIILRGVKKYPLKDKWKYYEFTDIEMNDPIEQIPIKYSKEIRKIAEYIIERCEELDEIEHLHNTDCNQHYLPTVDEAKKFVEKIIPNKFSNSAVPFPGRVD